MAPSEHADNIRCDIWGTKAWNGINKKDMGILRDLNVSVGQRNGGPLEGRYRQLRLNENVMKLITKIFI